MNEAGQATNPPIYPGPGLSELEAFALIIGMLY